MTGSSVEASIPAIYQESSFPVQRSRDPTSEGGTNDERFAAGPPSLLRALNERAILEHVRRHGPLTRAEIAAASGLSKPTVAQAVHQLRRVNLIREAGRRTGSQGPAAVLYELNPAAGWVVGVDVGRRRVRAAVADLAGTIIERVEQPARARSARSLVEQIGEVARRAARGAGLGWRRVSAVAVGTPGVPMGSGERVRLAHNLPGWNRAPILAEIRARLRSDVTFENDVNLAAIGEAWRGAGRNVADFVYLHLGTGVGLGVVLGGSLHRGASGAAGEIAYLPIPSGEVDQLRRRRGPLEEAIGARSIVEAARRRGLGRVRDVEDVFRAAREGDERAAAVVEEVAWVAARAIAAVVAVLDPGLVVVGGGVGRNADLLLEPIRSGLRALTPVATELVPAALGDEAELTGAVGMALRRAQERLFDRGAPRLGRSVEGG
ncbi:MAG: sugar kinase [Actinomycetota bacterium]|nr:MAG: sugar kinase [Actinomycetota bacterium]